jgi:hypothetical protein
MATDTLEALREAAVNAATALEVMGLSEAVVVNGERDLKAEALTVANRLRLALSRIDAALAPDHIGNSTTMVPTLGVAQIKATIWKHWRNQNGQTLEDRFTSAAEEIAAMEKNDG